MGRSGTSSLAGLLADSGYYLGKNLLKATKNNPKGYFESRDINFLNEDVLKCNTFTRPPFIGRYFFKNKPIYGQRWLSKINVKKNITSSQKTKRKIKSMVFSFNEKQPFAMKDPRFNFTLNIWEQFFNPTPKKICLFRHPKNTVQSILKFTENSGDSKVLNLDFNSVLEIWNNQYQYILKNLYTDNLKEDWLFIHFDQLLDKSAYSKIEKFLKLKLKSDFIDNEISIQKSTEFCDNLIYKRLCELADYE